VIRKVIDYIKEDNFEIRIDNDYINIINYLSVNYMEEDKISIRYKDGSILIKGQGLSVIKMLDEEILIKGLFSDLEFRRNDE